MRFAARSFAVVLAAATALWAPRIEATSCAVPELTSSTERADIVFVGTAGKIEQTGGGGTRVLFRVDRVHKGSVPAAVTVDAGGMKGATFEAGKRYLVFAFLPEQPSDPGPRPFAHLCGGSQPASEGHAWVTSLGAGNPPARAGSPVISGKGAAPSASSSAPSSPEPAPSATAQPAPAPSAAPPITIDASTPSAAPTPPTEQPRSGGCAGCSSAASPSTGAPVAAALASLLVALRRRPRPNARG